MTALALASIFTGAVIFVWGMRAIRNQRVNAFRFKLRSPWSTIIFGINSAVCGFLMMLTGVAAAAFMDADSVDILARSGLYMFGAIWGISLVLEALARVGWRVFPDHAPPEIRESRNTRHSTLRKRKQTLRETNIVRGAGFLSSSRWLLQTALNMFLLVGSSLYHRVTLPPRSLDKQNLWHGDREAEKADSGKPKTTTELDRKEFVPESRRANGEGKTANIAERQ